MLKKKWKKILLTGATFLLALSLAGCAEEDFSLGDDEVMVSDDGEKDGAHAEAPTQQTEEKGKTLEQDSNQQSGVKEGKETNSSAEEKSEKEKELSQTAVTEKQYADEDGNKAGSIFPSREEEGPKEGHLVQNTPEDTSDPTESEEAADLTEPQETAGETDDLTEPEDTTEEPETEQPEAEVDQVEANDYYIYNLISDIEGFVAKNSGSIPQHNYDCYYYYYYDYNHDGAVEIILDLIYEEGKVIVPISYDPTGQKILIHPYTEMKYDLEDIWERYDIFEYQGSFAIVIIKGEVGQGVITVKSLDNNGNFSVTATLNGDENDLDRLGFAYLNRYTTGEYTPLYIEN